MQKVLKYKKYHAHAQLRNPHTCHVHDVYVHDINIIYIYNYIFL